MAWLAHGSCDFRIVRTNRFLCTKAFVQPASYGINSGRTAALNRFFIDPVCFIDISAHIRQHREHGGVVFQYPR